MCGACIADPPPWERLHALWSYAPPVRELVHAWKFRRLDYLGVEPARELAVAVRRDREAAGVPPPDRVVPLPLAWTRRLCRGFNPTEIVAAELARALGRPWSRSDMAKLLAASSKRAHHDDEELPAQRGVLGLGVDPIK